MKIRVETLATRLVLFTFAAWMIFNLIQTGRYVIADYSGMPFVDYLREATFWPQYKVLNLSFLWIQHAQHRIIFPEIIFAVDLLLLRGRFYLPLAVSALCYLSIWFVFVWAGYSRKVMPRSVFGIALALAGVVMMWKGCSTLLAAPFQLTFTLMQVTGTLALAFLAKLSETASLRYLTALIAAAVIATYSMGSGMLIWPILIGFALLLRIGIQQLLVLVVSGALATGCYFIRYTFFPNNIRQSLRHPAMALGFLTSYMSMPFGSDGVRTLEVSIGAFSLLLAAGCAVVAGRRGLLKTRLGVTVFGSYLFVLLGAVLTSLGRMELPDINFFLAKQWRYLTLPCVGWATLAIALVWLASEVKGSRSSLILALSMAAFFAWGFANSREWVKSSRTVLQDAQIVTTMMRNEVFDPVTASGIFPDTERVRELTKVLRDDRKSIFARGADKWLRKDIKSLYPQKMIVPGEITRVVPVAGGLEILGWSESDWLTADHAVLFVDDYNKIAGFARQPGAGLPGDLAGWDLPRDKAFVGFVSLAKPIEHLTVYIRTSKDAHFLPLRSRIDVPTFTAITQEGVAPLPGVTWQSDAITGWGLDHYPLGPNYGPKPNSEIYGSGIGAPFQVGIASTAPMPVPSNHCVVLPELHSPDIFGELIQVEDADTKQVVARLPLLDGNSTWKRWRIPLPELTRNFIVKAQHADYRRWMALASPEPCP